MNKTLHKPLLLGAAAACICTLAACTRYNVAEPLTRLTNGNEVKEGTELTITPGGKWSTDNTYRNFIFTGKAQTGEGTEASSKLSSLT